MADDLMSPQLQIYNEVFKASLRLGFDTYDYLPANKVNMPFVYVGEQSDQDLRTKTSLYGQVQQTIHIYHTYKQRRELTDMMNALKVECRRLKRTANFYVTCRNITAQTLLDDTTGEPLLHGIVEVEFRFH